MTPQFTIVSCFRNAGRYVARHIESVQAQTLSNWQHVIIDDDSEDDSWTHVDRAMPRDDARIWAFRRPRRQWKLANVLWAFPCMRGDVLVELDGDDWFAAPTALSTIAAAYAANPRAEATCGSFRGYPRGSIVSPATQPCRGQRLMQNGFASSTPAPRTWKRALTERSLAEMPQLYTDPQTGRPWQTNADLALYAPATLWAEHIATIDEVLVEANFETPHHDFALPNGQQRDEGMRLYEYLIAEEWRINAPLLRPFTQKAAPDA